MKELTLPKIIIIVVVALVAFIGANIATILYSSGVNSTKIERLQDDVREKPSNDILLQYMRLTDERFRVSEIDLDEHVDDFERARENRLRELKQLEDRIIRIEDKYLMDAYRSEKKKLN